MAPGAEAVGEVLEQAAPGVEGGAVAQRLVVARRGAVRCERGVEGFGAQVAQDQAEVVGGVGDGGVAPVDDAGDRPRRRVDEDVLDAEVVVGEHGGAGRVVRRRGGEEGLDRRAVLGRQVRRHVRVGRRGLPQPPGEGRVVDVGEAGHARGGDAVQRGQQPAEGLGDRGGALPAGRFGQVEQGCAGELGVRQATQVRDGQDRLGDRQRGDAGHGGEQPGLAVEPLRVGLAGEADDELAVDVEGHVVEPGAERRHGRGPAARQVGAEDAADVRHGRGLGRHGYSVPSAGAARRRRARETGPRRTDRHSRETRMTEHPELDGMAKALHVSNGDATDLPGTGIAPRASSTGATCCTRARCRTWAPAELRGIRADVPLPGGRRRP